MKELVQSFRLNGLQYTLMKRDEYVALYGLSGEYTDKVISYEVDIINIRKDQFGEREHIAANSDFGKDRSRCYNNEQKALEYYDGIKTILREERNLSKGVPKSI